MLKVFKGLLDKTGSAEICPIRWEKCTKSNELTEGSTLENTSACGNSLQKGIHVCITEINQARQNQFTLGNKE